MGDQANVRGYGADIPKSVAFDMQSSGGYSAWKVRVKARTMGR